MPWPLAAYESARPSQSSERLERATSHRFVAQQQSTGASSSRARHSVSSPSATFTTCVMLARASLRPLSRAATLPARVALRPSSASFSLCRPLREAQARSAELPLADKPDQLRIRPRLRMTFTCTAPVRQADVGADDASPSSVAQCGHRSTHEFSRHSYEKGIVLVQCPSCSVRCVCAWLAIRMLSAVICESCLPVVRR